MTRDAGPGPLADTSIALTRGSAHGNATLLTIVRTRMHRTGLSVAFVVAGRGEQGGKASPIDAGIGARRLADDAMDIAPLPYFAAEYDANQQRFESLGLSRDAYLAGVRKVQYCAVLAIVLGARGRGER